MTWSWFFMFVVAGFLLDAYRFATGWTAGAVVGVMVGGFLALSGEDDGRVS